MIWTLVLLCPRTIVQFLVRQTSEIIMPPDSFDPFRLGELTLEAQCS